MIIFLDESKSKPLLIPFSHTRHVADIRVGILTIKEKWALLLPKAIFVNKPGAGALKIDAAVIPTLDNYKAILNSSTHEDVNDLPVDFKSLSRPWHISQYNDWAIRKDFEIITRGKTSEPIPSVVQASGEENIFIEKGAILRQTIINAENGPVYIARNAEIMEGSLIRGPVAICENAVLKMGTKIYAGSTIGPYCVAGGEIKNSLLMGHSNKAHDGYLGDSVIGEWCNLGAGTSNSNLKNTGGNVRYKLSEKENSIEVGTKAGLLMGDYSRAAINTSFNTGSVVGVCCNIFSERNPPVFVPDFSWGNEKYILEKAFRDIDNWKKMKGQAITQEEKNILQQLYNQ
jgi:UDP-N-acetylglucosamine diphosphorylase/glucosamine-1-phosphate N-acetyltransferase